MILSATGIPVASSTPLIHSTPVRGSARPGAISGPLSGSLSFIGTPVVITVSIMDTGMHACSQTAYMCADAYTAIPNTNACSNASNVEAGPGACEDYPSACAESIRISRDTERKPNGKGYCKKEYT